MKRFTALLLCLVTLITATITVYADSIQPFSNNVNSTEVSRFVIYDEFCWGFILCRLR